MSAPLLEGRGAVVTGGGRGIGAAVAGALAAAGAGVVVASRTASEIERVAGRLRDAGMRAWSVVCDVTCEPDVDELRSQAVARLGTVDLLVCSAGEGASAPLARISLDSWNAMLAVHATGSFLCTRAFAPGMVQRKWGRIVHVASLTGLEGAKYVAHYSAAKHAVIGLMRSAAVELAGSGVTVNAVCPGYVDTPMTERTLAGVQQHTGLDRERALAAVLASAGQHRLIAPEEVAEAVLALCGESAAGTTGQAIPIRDEAHAR